MVAKEGQWLTDSCGRLSRDALNEIRKKTIISEFEGGLWVLDDFLDRDVFRLNAQNPSGSTSFR